MSFVSTDRTSCAAWWIRCSNSHHSAMVSTVACASGQRIQYSSNSRVREPQLPSDGKSFTTLVDSKGCLAIDVPLLKTHFLKDKPAHLGSFPLTDQMIKVRNCTDSSKKWR